MTVPSYGTGTGKHNLERSRPQRLAGPAAAFRGRQHPICGTVRKMNEMKRFFREEDGVGVVEVILILLVLIALVLIFKQQLISLVHTILGKVVSQSNQV